MIWYRLSLVRTRAKSGKVVSVDKKNGTVVVEGINKVFKHSKPSMANQQAESSRWKLQLTSLM